MSTSHVLLALICEIASVAGLTLLCEIISVVELGMGAICLLLPNIVRILFRLTESLLRTLGQTCHCSVNRCQRNTTTQSVITCPFDFG